MYLGGAEIQLKTADSGPRTGWRPDLGRILGQGADVVPQNRRIMREQRTRQLDPIARIAGKADDCMVHLLELADFSRLLRRLTMGGHDCFNWGTIVVMLI